MTRSLAILTLLILFSSCEKNHDNIEPILKLYGDAYEDIGYSIARDNNGYIIAGQFTGITRNENNFIEGSRKQMAVIKTDAEGNTIWKRGLGDRSQAVGLKVITLEDGSIISTGYIIDTVTLKKDLFVVKMDADGTGPQYKIFKHAGNQFGTDIIKTQEGFMILGTTDVPKPQAGPFSGNVSGKKDILIFRIDNNLEKIYEIAHGFPGDDEGLALKADRDGGYIVVGTTDRSELDPDEQAGNNIFLLRVNEDGSATYPGIIGRTEDEYAADIEVLNDGYLVAGTIGNEETDQKGYIWRLSSDIYAPAIDEHEIVIFKTPSERLFFSIKAISKYKTNSFIMAGQSGTGSSADMLIFITDSDGNLVKDKVMVTGSTGMQVAFDVISDDDDNIIAVGKNSYENNSMISLFKFKF